MHLYNNVMISILEAEGLSYVYRTIQLYTNLQSGAELMKLKTHLTGVHNDE